MNPTDLPAVLQWLAGPGAAYLVGWILSLVVENVPAWAKVPTVIKTLAPMLLSVLVSLGAVLLLKQTAFLETVGPWWALVIQALLGYLGTQQAFLNIKKAGYGLRFRKG